MQSYPFLPSATAGKVWCNNWKKFSSCTAGGRCDGTLSSRHRYLRSRILRPVGRPVVCLPCWRGIAPKDVAECKKSISQSFIPGGRDTSISRKQFFATRKLFPCVDSRAFQFYSFFYPWLDPCRSIGHIVVHFLGLFLLAYLVVIVPRFHTAQ